MVYVSRLNARCFVVSVSLHSLGSLIFRAFHPTCWVTAALKFKLLSTTHHDCHSQGGVGLSRLQFRIFWNLILLAREQWKEGFQGVFGAGKKTRKGACWLASEIHTHGQSCLLYGLGGGCLKYSWEGFQGLENNSWALGKSATID